MRLCTRDSKTPEDKKDITQKKRGIDICREGNRKYVRKQGAESYTIQRWPSSAFELSALCDWDLI